MITRKQALELLWSNPIEIGHWVGFNDLTQLHNEWLRSFLYGDEDQTLQAHRGSFKTTTLSIFLALHIVIAPNETVLFFRKTGSDVVEVIRQTINILQSGCVREIVRAIYGKDLVLLRSSSSEIHTNLCTRTSGSSQVVGLGIGTSITGKHADIIVTDDIVNVNDRTSRAERERTKLAYMELQNIKNRGGRFINTGTPWHKDDAFSLMPNIRRYDCYSTGLMSDAQIKAIKERMTNSLFAANYELKHIASENVIFENPKIVNDYSMVEQGVAHIDAAYYGEDYTALSIVAIHDGKFYVLGKCWRRHVDDVIDEVVAILQRFNVNKIYCELNSDKGYLAKQMRNRGLRVSTYQETQNKYIKIVSYLKFEWPDVIFVNGTDDKYLEQICDYNEDAEHDDCPDSLASLIRITGRRKDEARLEYKPMLI